MTSPRSTSTRPRTDDAEAPPTPSTAGEGVGRLAAFGIHVAIFTYVAWRGTYRPSDFVGPDLFHRHGRLVSYAFTEWWRPLTPGYLYRFVAQTFNVLLGQSDELVGAVITCAIAYGVFGVALYETYRRTVAGTPLLSRRAAVGASVLVALLESPAALWGWTRFMSDGLFLPMYLPFVPTTLVSLGLNLFLLLAVSDLVTGRTRRDRRWVVPALVVAAALAKPTLIPVLAVAAVVVVWWDDRERRRAGEASRLRDVIVLVVIPSVVIMALQLLVTIYKLEYPAEGWDDRGGWTILPFEELRALQALNVKFFLFLLFPIVALAVAGRRLLADRSVRLSVVATLVGLAMALLLSRTGSDYRGDMLQPLEAAMSIAIIVMIRRLIELRRAGELTVAGAVWCGLALAPYVAAGLTSYSCHVGLGCPAL